MKGTVFRRGKRWSVVIDLGRDPETNKRRREWHSGFSTRRAAEAARVDVLAKLQSGIHAPPNRQTFGEYLLKEWLPIRVERLAPNTARIEETQVRAFILPRLGMRRLVDLTPAELEKFYTELRASGRLRDGGPLAPKTVKNVAGIVHKALADAERLGKIARNPAGVAQSPKVPRSLKRVWSPTELRQFLDAIDDERLAVSFLVAAATGLRRSELLGLPWTAVDLEKRSLSVAQALVLVGSTPTIRLLTKTASSRRTIALDARTVDALRSLRKKQIEQRLAAGSLWEESGLVFTGEIGRPIHPDTWSRTFARLVAHSDLPRIPAMNLRHTHASILLESGVDLRVVSGRLGHSSVAITGDVYASFVDRMDRQAADAAAAEVFGS